MGCLEITQKLEQICDEEGRISPQLVAGDYETVLVMQSKVEETVLEVMDKIDPYRVPKRDKIARRLNLAYVGEIVDGFAVAQVKQPDLGLPDCLVDCEEEKIITGPSKKILPLFHGRTFIFQQDHAELFDVKRGVIIKYKNNEYSFQQESWRGEGVIAAYLMDTAPNGQLFRAGSAQINFEGNQVVRTPGLEPVRQFSNGIVLREFVDRFNAYDINGQRKFTLNKTQVDEVFKFTEDMAIGLKRNAGNAQLAKVLIIDKSGNIFDNNIEITTSGPEDALHLYFEDGFALARDKRRGWFFLNKKGNQTFIQGGLKKRIGNLAVMEQIKRSKQYFALFTPNGLIGMFSHVAEFCSEGYTAISYNGVVWQYLRDDGEFLQTEEKFIAISAFSEGYASVIGEGVHYIDKNGKDPFAGKGFKFKKAGSFHQGVAKVTVQNGEEYYIDKFGGRVFE